MIYCVSVSCSSSSFNVLSFEGSLEGFLYNIPMIQTNDILRGG